MVRFSTTAGLILLIAVSELFTPTDVRASENDALAISSNIQQLHLPYGTILAPIFASTDPSSPDYSNVVGYTRAGDSALWTGHYLAAEAFRYQVTRSPEALANAWRALHGLRSLLDVTGNNVLARCLFPVDSPHAAAIQQEEGGHGIYSNGTHLWIGNTSRDQYSGVMFGLSIAYELIDVPDVRAFIRDDVTRILNFLLGNNWNVVMPDGRISTTFVHRPDQFLSFLQVGRMVNPSRFGSLYNTYRFWYASSVSYPIFFDNIDTHNHYFKFNLNYINLFNLVRLEDSSFYRRFYMDAYESLRGTTREHGNAHFNMLDRALKGADAGRDAETMTLIESWLGRPRRDYWIDLRGAYPSCGFDQSCSPISVEQRVNTDFLWQRSPFLLFGGGIGQIETAGIDYILPYWMARHYGLPLN